MDFAELLSSLSSAEILMGSNFLTYWWVVMTTKIVSKFQPISKISPNLTLFKKILKWPPAEAVLRLRSKLCYSLIPYPW